MTIPRLSKLNEQVKRRQGYLTLRAGLLIEV